MTINVGKDFNMTVGGESNHSLTAAKKLNIHTDADAEIDADGQLTVASQKNMYVKSKAKLDIAKG